MSIILIASIVVGACIIIALGIYAGRLIFMVKRQGEQQQQVRNKRIASKQSSIQTIAFAIQQQQCDLSEGTV
jgi:hypothetical protein